MMAFHTSLRRGQQLVAQGNWAEASETLRQGREDHPDEARLALQHLRLLTEQGEFEEGQQLAADLRKRFPDHAPSLLFIGKLHFAAKDFTVAIEAFTACLELNPGNLLARDYLALAQWVSNERPEALGQLLTGQLSHNVDFLCDFTESAERILIEEGLKVDSETAGEDFPEESEESAEDDLASQEKSGWPWEVKIPFILFHIIPFSRRRRTIRRCFRRTAKFYDRKEFAAVLEEMDQLLGVAPDLVMGRWIHAEAQFYLQRFPEANREMELLVQAAELPRFQKNLTETLPFIQSMQGYMLLRQGRFDKALALLEKVIPFGPDDFMGHYYRGVCLQALGRWREGREQLRIAWGEYQFSTDLWGMLRLKTELKLLNDAGQGKNSTGQSRSSGIIQESPSGDDS